MEINKFQYVLEIKKQNLNLLLINKFVKALQFFKNF